MRDQYGRIYPSFWTGETGRKMRALPPETRLVALWTISNRLMDPTGIYYAPIPMIAHEVGCPFEGASKALRSLSEIGFCHYDAPSETIWVPEMAAHQFDRVLKPGDKRRVMILEQLDRIRKTPFYNDFVTRYRDAFGLKECPLQAPSKPLASPFEGASTSSPLLSSVAVAPLPPACDPPTPHVPRPAPTYHAPPPATTGGDVYVSTPSPLPPPGSDNWAAIKPLVEAGLNTNQAHKVVQVWRLPTDVILAEIARQKDGKGGTGALMARLRTLADVRNAESMGHIPKTAPPELPHERAARESREALAALAEERRRTNEEWLRKNGNAAPCHAEGSPRPKGRASDGNGAVGKGTQAE